MILILGALLGFISVAFAAFAEHGLRQRGYGRTLSLSHDSSAIQSDTCVSH